jgi:hypothetical protein
LRIYPGDPCLIRSLWSKKVRGLHPKLLVNVHFSAFPGQGNVPCVKVALQDSIYGLAFRMLCNREGTEDATWEILARIVTRLSQFDFRSKLTTWAYRVAVNYILDVPKSPVERLHLSFEQFAEGLPSVKQATCPTGVRSVGSIRPLSPPQDSMRPVTLRVGSPTSTLTRPNMPTLTFPKPSNGLKAGEPSSASSSST